MNDSESKTLNFQNDFKDNNIDTAFDLKGALIGKQYNIYQSYKTFKTINFHKKIKIKVKKHFLDKQEITHAVFSLFFGILIIVMPFLIFYFELKLDVIQFVLITLVLFAIFSFLFIFFVFIVSNIFTGYLKFEKSYNKFIFWNEQNKLEIRKIKFKKFSITYEKEMYIVIEFKDYQKKVPINQIRGYMKNKSILGYAFYIYHINNLYPIIQFNIESIHVANTLEDLLEHTVSSSL